jgi:hypothetical protein
MESTAAAEIMALPDTVSMLLTPFTGIFVDLLGHRTHILIACTLLLSGVHVTLGWLGGSPTGIGGRTTWLIPYAPLCILGLCYSFLLIFWPIVPLVSL